MSTLSKAAAVIASAGVLAAGWQIGTANGATVATATTPNPTTTVTVTTTPTTSSSTSSSTTTSSDSSSSSSSSSSSTTSSSSSSGSYKDGTYTGETVTERYGTVTVTVTVSGGKITDVQAATTVHEQHSQRYVQAAVPTLRSEVLAAQSAEVNMVSGATFTSEAYLTSLQSALDQAS